MIHTQAYKDLLIHQQKLQEVSLRELFAQDNTRFQKFSFDVEGLFLDYSKNNITEETIQLLVKLAHESNLIEQIQAMFSGHKINNTENRAVLHTALRSPNKAVFVDGIDVSIEIGQVLQRMSSFSHKLHSGIHRGYTGKLIRDIVNIGIGGSDLGPVLVCQALKPFCKNNLNIHFISSVDGYQTKDVLASLNPETTLIIIASKTFTTQETMTNAATARKWFLDYSQNNVAGIKYHFVAASTNTQAVAEFGIDLNNMFQFWDFVGGRYSLWSAIGLAIILYVGFDVFSELLAGAHAMDEHFLQTTNFHQNMPVILALLGVWYNNFYNYTSHIISPYNIRLSRFPAYVQQLEMESNGKSVNKAGESLNYATCPIIWGDSGINGQHAYYQLLHQGTSINPMDIIVSLKDKFSSQEHNNILIANAFAQAEAFMCGKTHLEAKQELLRLGMSEAQAGFLAKHKVFPGNRPSNVLLMPDLSAYNLGLLIALYEHKTFVQGVVWEINSFDQMGVELGKQLAKNILNDINSGKVSKHDNSSYNLIKRYIDSNKSV